MLLTNRHTIVTGGSRGVGFEISRIFLEQGAHVLAVSRDHRKLDGAKRELPALDTLAADVAKADDVDRIVEWVGERWGKLDILVNNAGMWTSEAPDLTTGTDEDFAETIRINLFGAYYCTKRFLPLLLKSDDPRIMNVGSRSGLLNAKTHGAYGVSKVALHGLTVATAHELAGKVAVNALSPGWVRTDAAPDAPWDPRWSAEAALSLVTRPREVTGQLFHGKRRRRWSTI